MRAVHDHGNIFGKPRYRAETDTNAVGRHLIKCFKAGKRIHIIVPIFRGQRNDAASGIRITITGGQRRRVHPKRRWPAGKNQSRPPLQCAGHAHLGHQDAETILGQAIGSAGRRCGAAQNLGSCNEHLQDTRPSRRGWWRWELKNSSIITRITCDKSAACSAAWVASAS